MLKYAKVQESTQKYVKVRESMQKYARLCESTQEYAKVCKSTQNYAKVQASMIFVLCLESMLIANNRHFDCTLIAFFRSNFLGGVKASPSTVCTQKYTKVCKST